mgnify:FL=1
MSDWSDFGGMLRSTRECLAWSIEDVAHRTRIPVATLRQLENNDYSKFASQAYAKSFLAQYCEHLGLDAAEQLDSFETGDALANLDSYEYLKDHTEHVDAAPLQMKRAKPRKEKVRKAKEERSGRPAALQPLMVFSATALLITGAVFGFMKLSAKLSDGDNFAREEPAENLIPVAAVPNTNPINEFANIPRAIVTSEGNLVAGNPGGTSGTETLSATPTTQADAPIELNLDNPPPRAVIVEE